MDNIRIETYFIACDEEKPIQIFFTLQDAEKELYPYIDVFDQFGKKIISYEYDEDIGEYKYAIPQIQFD